jgi:hypothetical protein
MMDNHLYNLMVQLVHEHKSLWRIKNKYMEDAGDCVDCKKFWEEMSKDKEAQVVKLQELVKTHLK